MEVSWNRGTPKSSILIRSWDPPLNGKPPHNSFHPDSVEARHIGGQGAKIWRKSSLIAAVFPSTGCIVEFKWAANLGARGCIWSQSPHRLTGRCPLFQRTFMISNDFGFAICSTTSSTQCFPSCWTALWEFPSCNSLSCSSVYEKSFVRFGMGFAWNFNPAGVQGISCFTYEPICKYGPCLQCSNQIDDRCSGLV